MTLTPAVKLHSMALLEAKQKCTVWMEVEEKGLQWGPPEIWIQIQFWDHRQVTSLWTSVTFPHM